MPGRFLKRLALACLLLSLAGCNAVKLTYNNAQGLAYWWLDGYADFTPEQKPQVYAQLARLHDWHRQDELPEYIRLLERILGLTQQDVAPDEVCAIVDATRKRTAVLNTHLSPIVAAIGPQLSARQLQHIGKQFAKKNEDWREKWLDDAPDARIDRRMKEARKQAEAFYGALNNRQEALLRKRLEATGFDPARVYQEKLRRQQAMLRILGKLQDNGTREEALRETEALLQDLTAPQDKNYRQYIDHVTQESCKTIAALHNSTTPEQRRKAAVKLQSYIDDLRALQAPPPG